MKVIGCKGIFSGVVRKCVDCLRAPYFSDECIKRIEKHTDLGWADQYYYEAVYGE